MGIVHQTEIDQKDVESMACKLTDAILHIENFVRENGQHSTDANLRDAMNLTASALGTCHDLKLKIENDLGGSQNGN